MKCMWVAAWVPGYLLGLPSGPAGFPAVFLTCLWRSTDTNTKKESASPFGRYFSFFFSMFSQVIKQSILKKPLLGETVQRKLCDIHQVRHSMCRACLALLADLERRVVLLGHQYLASHCGWRLSTQPETNRLSMGDQTTPQQMLNCTFIYDNSAWVLIISWTSYVPEAVCITA